MLFFVVLTILETDVTGAERSWKLILSRFGEGQVCAFAYFCGDFNEPIKESFC